MPGQRSQSGEAFTHHMDVEMAAPVARAGMASMAMAVILDLEHAGCQRLLQRITDPLDPFRVHGRTLRNGRTCTRV